MSILTKSKAVLPKADRESIVVHAPPAQVYEYWSHFEDFPPFIKPLQNLHKIDDANFSFTWIGHGQEQRGTLHVLLRIPGRRIAWRILTDRSWLGVVSFEPRPNRSTEITLKVSSAAESSTLSQQLRQYLENLKRLIEKSSKC